MSATTPAQEMDIVERLERLRSEIHRRSDRTSFDTVAIDTAIERLRDVRAAVIDMEARKDAAYLERNQVVAALAAAYPSGISRTAILGWLAEWHGCVYIDLPTGQASWHYHDSHAHLFAHLPPYAGHWDGHTTDEKYERLRALSNRRDARAADAEIAAQLRKLLAAYPLGTMDRPLDLMAKAASALERPDARATIEECAKVADSYGDYAHARDIARRIRALANRSALPS